jgi:methionyl-tRNA formyltransferase
VHRAVIAGETQTGVTIMRIVKALDAGPMLDKATRAIGPNETSAEVERDLARMGADLLVRVVDRLAAGPINEIPQDDAAATYAPRLTREDGAIDWRRPAVDVHNLIRGLHPWPHASAFLKGRRYILRRSEVVASAQMPAAPGTVLSSEGDRLIVATGSGSLRIVEIQPEGKRSLTSREFLAGHRIESGAAFS